MSKFTVPSLVTIEELIAFVQRKEDRNFRYDVFSQSGDDFEHGQTVLVDHTVQVDDDDQEIYPETAKRNKYRFAYSGEQFQDVVDLATKQKPNASVAEVIEALNHYSNNDDFLDLA